LAASAGAQQIVHALSGTVTKVDATAHTLQVKTNDGSEGVFTFTPNGTAEVSFDRTVKSEVTPVASFNKQDDTVVVFYYGNSSTRTAVAVQDLGPGPFQAIEGTVTRFNKHQHELTLKDANGKEQTFHMGEKAVADSMNGAVPGDRFEPSKGDNVRVIAAKGTDTALFVRD
jgi:phosphotransferase system IIA component